MGRNATYQRTLRVRAAGKFPIGASAAAVLLCPVLLAAPAVAQGSGSLARVPAGGTVRVQTSAGEVLEGAFRAGADSVYVEAGAVRRAIALDDVRSVWYQQRETRKGAVAGALLGGAAGGAFLGLLGFVVTGSGSETATMIGIGLLGGGAAGGVLGGVVGAAVPRWTLAYPAGGAAAGAAPPSVTAGSPARAGRRRLGAVDGALGYGRVGGDEPTDGGPGGRIALHAEFGTEPAPGSTARFLTVGPELGWFDLGGTGLVRRHIATDSLEMARRFTAATAGGVVRGGLAGAAWRGYALAGLAYNRWEIDEGPVRWLGPGPPPDVVGTGQGRFEHLGYIVGGGGQVRLAPRTGVGLELRRTAVGTFDMDLPGSYWTVTMTATHRW